MSTVRLLIVAALLAIVGFQLYDEANADGYLVRDGQKIFVNGVNFAWNQFAHDLSDRYAASSLVAFTSWFKNIKDAGGNFARLWIHTNGVDTPAFSNGLVTGMGPNVIDRIIKILDAAAANNIMVELALWSFDMFNPTQWEMTQTHITQNNAVLRTASGRKAYIDNALVPLVKALKGHKGLFGYDIFNEPEGIIAGWSLGSCGNIVCPPKYTIDEVRVFVNQFAGAIRAIDSTTFITVGSGVGKGTFLGWYTDSALIAAGGDPKGILTHSSMHYYPYGSSQNPFDYPASYWGVEKPIIIGEFPGIGFNRDMATQQSCGKMYKLTTSQYKSSKQCYEHAYNNGYAGLSGWQYKSTSGCNKQFIGDWADLKLGVEALKGKQCISFSDATCKVSSGLSTPSTCPLSSKSLQTTAANWVYRNGWALGDGSTLTTSGAKVVVQPRQNGRQFFWLIYTGERLCVKKGKTYTVSLTAVEDSINKIYSSNVKCATTNGCLGKTIKSLSVSLIGSFEESVVVVPDGVDPKVLVKTTGATNNMISFFENNPTTPVAISQISKDIQFSEDATAVSFGIRVELFGKPSLTNNKYTISSITIKEKTTGNNGETGNTGDNEETDPNCTKLSSSALKSEVSSWVVRNGWGLGDGTILSNAASALTLQTRKWGRQFYWLIYTAESFCVKKGESYSFKTTFSEDLANKISNSNVACSATNGCLGNTVQEMSLSFIKNFSSTAYLADGVDSSTLAATTESSTGDNNLYKTSGSSKVPQSLTKTVQFNEDASSVTIAIKVTLNGKPSLAANKYTLESLTLTKQ